ncbi:hypothetical protein RFI_22913 [Reticulomyxa filosa]|uniref:Uncharacterized protein n=1 Tax=Reticulomyxa filosa TaxID=46433 RepID=X6MN03_RETFI|nr:hypothetical protein RFI_22913 [Reticulomyxa filosa]|eukprot:ETO14455.1 hypothetical protein RFI_22913 [Reticulomyxa filosa]
MSSSLKLECGFIGLRKKIISLAFKKDNLTETEKKGYEQQVETYLNKIREEKVSSEACFEKLDSSDDQQNFIFCKKFENIDIGLIAHVDKNKRKKKALFDTCICIKKMLVKKKVWIGSWINMDRLYHVCNEIMLLYLNVYFKESKVRYKGKTRYAPLQILQQHLTEQLRTVIIKSQHDLTHAQSGLSVLFVLMREKKEAF